MQRPITVLVIPYGYWESGFVEQTETEGLLGWFSITFAGVWATSGTVNDAVLALLEKIPLRWLLLMENLDGNRHH